MGQFKDMVLSMTGREIMQTMINGILKEHVKIDMSYFGDVRGEVCFGCAATNMICEVSDKVLTSENITEKSTRAIFIGVDVFFLEYFEYAIDYLRIGNVTYYNYYADKISMSKIPVLDYLPLPCLYNDNYKEDLHYYQEYCNALK